MVVAFSGGLDTTFCVRYLKEQQYAVITVTADTGGMSLEELSHIEERAHELGVYAHHTFHVRQELFDRFGTYIIKGNILRGGVYPLCVGSERVIQAEYVVRVAEQYGAQTVCHGCSGAGNDQVRFDTAIKVLNPSLVISAPIRDLALSREATLDFLKDRNIDFPSERKKYSVNQGIFGTTLGGAETHDSWQSIPDYAYVRTVSPQRAPEQIGEIEIGFTQGMPCLLNKKRMEGYEILEAIDSIGAAHGVGRGYHIGDTVIGIKGRLAFEAPGAMILIAAHRELEKLVLTKWQSHIKEYLCAQYGMLFHEGLWLNPVMRDIEHFIDSTQQKVSGEVRVELFKGTVAVTGCKSPHSLMTSAATYGEGTTLWSAEEVAGFSKLFGLQTVLAASS